MRSEEAPSKLFLKMDVVAENGASFILTSDGNTLKVFPKENFHLGDFMRFYRFVLDRIDAGAFVVLNDKGEK